MRNPTVGDIYRHKNGQRYIIESIRNLPNEERYPLTICYINVNNKTEWSRRYDDWDRSMTFVEHNPNILIEIWKNKIQRILID